MKKLKQIGLNAKKAFSVLKSLESKKKDRILLKYIQLLSENKKQILQENLKDVRAVKRKHLIDRLILDV